MLEHFVRVVCVCLCVCVCVRVRVCVCARARAYACVCVCVRARAYACACVCVRALSPRLSLSLSHRSVLNVGISDGVARTLHILFRLVAHVNVALLDELDGKIVELLKIVRRIGDFDRLVA